jgi:hypothetical protein
VSIKSSRLSWTADAANRIEMSFPAGAFVACDREAELSKQQTDDFQLMRTNLESSSWQFTPLSKET